MPEIVELDDFHTEVFIEMVRTGHVNDETIQYFLSYVQEWYWNNKEAILKGELQ